MRLSGPGVAAGWQEGGRVPLGPLVRGPHVAATTIAASAALAAILRLPFLRTGLSPDEGGYAYVAEQWARGARLYGADWVDRPQGLLVVYRVLLDAGHSAWSIRLGALLFGCGITLLLGVIGWLLKGPWVGAVAALVYAVLGVAPYLQGFTFNGELAAALPSAGAVAAALAWRRDGRGLWLVVAGAAGALGPLMKQSGFDGLLVALAVVVAGGRPRRRSVGLVLAGAAVPLALSVLHGLLVGWGNYWYAVAGYKLSAPSGASLDVAKRLGALGASWLGARRDLALPLALAFAVAAISAVRRKDIRIPAVWFAAALVGVNAASLYWAHYYVQLLAPLALLLAVGASNLPGRVTAAAAVLLVVGPPASKLVALDELSPAARQRVIPYYAQFVRDRRIAREVDRLTRPGEAIYALDSEADLYFLANRPAAFEYLWGHPLEEVPGALGRLRALLDGPRRPELVVVFRSPKAVDRSGALGAILAHRYRRLETVPGTRIRILQRSAAARDGADRLRRLVLLLPR